MLHKSTHKSDEIGSDDNLGSYIHLNLVGHRSHDLVIVNTELVMRSIWQDYMSLDISSVIFVGYVNTKITRINVRTATLFYTDRVHADLF